MMREGRGGRTDEGGEGLMSRERGWRGWKTRVGLGRGVEVVWDVETVCLYDMGPDYDHRT